MRSEAQSSPMRLPAVIQRSVRVVTTTVRLYTNDRCGIYAAAIAYYAIFSLIPISLITLSVVGLVTDRERVVDYVFEQIPLEESPSVREDVDAIVQRARDLSVAGISFGALALVWSSTGIFSAVRQGLNATSHGRKGRPYWHGKLIDIAMVPALGLLILLSLLLTAAARVAIERATNVGFLDLDAEGLALQMTTFVLPALLSFLLFSVLYRFVPTERPSWREALPGAAFATLLFETANNLMAWVISISAFTREAAIYASLSTALAFLLWMFVNASILLLGAEFARALAGDSPGREVEPQAAQSTRWWRRAKGLRTR